MARTPKEDFNALSKDELIERLNTLEFPKSGIGVTQLLFVVISALPHQERSALALMLSQLEKTASLGAAFDRLNKRHPLDGVAKKSAQLQQYCV